MRFIGGDQGDQLTREVRAVASGALPSGDPVVVNSDGTVSVVEETSVSQAIGTAVDYPSSGGNVQRTSVAYSGVSEKVLISYQDNLNSSYGTAVVGTINTSTNSISFGTPVVFNSGSSEVMGSVYDEASGNPVISYKDPSDDGYAVVGSVSGTSVTFGTPVLFSSTADSIGVAYDSNSQKVVFAYSGGSDYGTAVVGTVSGTSISFGTEVTFASATTYTNTGCIAYDANAQRIVIGYTDAGNSQYGTAIVGTVSGTSISFGSEVAFKNAKSEQINVAYEPTSQKVLLAYYDNDSDGKARVGTVSGTSISVGTEVTFETGRTFGINSTGAQKNVVISYEDDGDSEKGKLIVGTISGTTVSFGTAVEYESIAINGNTFGGFDATSGRVVVGYEEKSSGQGRAVVFQPASDATNLTSENFIGFAQSGFPDTGNAVIDSKGAINDKQSGLTPGQGYYVQTDGTLSTTADDPSVFAGTAVAANKIIVEG